VNGGEGAITVLKLNDEPAVKKQDIIELGMQATVMDIEIMNRGGTVELLAVWFDAEKRSFLTRLKL
jgi:hypothetical protein